MKSLNQITSNLSAFAATVALTGTCLGLGMTSANAAIIDLGFSLDRSGSVGSSNWNLVVNGLANALNNPALISGPDQYRISVVSFSTTATTVVLPTILTAANLATVQAAILADPFSGGSTCISCSIALLTSNQAAAGFGDTSLINISTDGEPNVGNTDGVSVRNGAISAGWDGISAEAIGSFDLSYLDDLVAPQPAFNTNDPNNLPDPRVQGFVLTVNDFEDYAPAISAKVSRIVETPEPSTLLGLLAVGGLGFGLARKK